LQPGPLAVYPDPLLTLNSVQIIHNPGGGFSGSIGSTDLKIHTLIAGQVKLLIRLVFGRSLHLRNLLG
jgi:hypothetical protein